MAALHPPLTLRAVADLDVEAPHHRAHHGQFFLILRRHARHLDRAAAVRTRRRCRRRVVLVDLGRARTARLPPVGRAGPPARMPAAPLGSVLGEGGRLPESGSACGRQLLLEVVDLPLQAVVLTPQAFVAALQAFVLVSQARAGRPRRPRPFSAPLFLLRAWLPFLTAISSALVGHTRVMPYCEKLYKYKIVVSQSLNNATPLNEYRLVVLARRSATTALNHHFMQDTTLDWRSTSGCASCSSTRRPTSPTAGSRSRSATAPRRTRRWASRPASPAGGAATR